MTFVRRYKSLVKLAMIALSMNGANAFANNAFEVKTVAFKSGEHTLSGMLFTPEKPNNKSVTIVGPVGFVKEQAPSFYAQELAAKGYTALVFDPTYHGASEGMPRRYESGDQKTKDIIASIDYLSQKSNMNADEIYGVGICQGINWMTRASVQDKRIKSVSLIAGHYLHPDVAVKYNGGEEKLQQALAKAKVAKEKFEQNGEVEYIPIVGTSEEEALLQFKPIYDWYIPWATNTDGRGGQWENRITRMSILDIWGGNTETDLKKLNKPTLVIHSNKAASGPVVTKALFSSIGTDEKKLVWFEDQFQTKFYDDLPTIKRAVNQIDQWFNPSSKGKLD